MEKKMKWGVSPEGRWYWPDGWKVPGFKGTPTPNYMRHDFTDYENNVAYYCTFGNGCVYCRYAPHARNVGECIFVISKPYRS